MDVFRKPADSERNLRATIYVGNLMEQVTEPLLYELFLQVSPIKLLYLPKDRVTRAHQGYGFVEFPTVTDADYALQVFRGVRLFGRTLNLKNLDGNHNGDMGDLSVGARVFVGNLNPLVDAAYLSEAFLQFGGLLGVPQIVPDKNHGFVEFGSFEAADAAIDKMNGALLMNSKARVSYALKPDGKTYHGDEAERLLAAQAKENIKKQER